MSAAFHSRSSSEQHDSDHHAGGGDLARPQAARQDHGEIAFIG
jgi:hypothetical protein